MLSCSQSNHLTSGICKCSDYDYTAEPIPSIVCSSRVIPIEGADSLSVKSKTYIAQQAKYACVMLEILLLVKCSATYIKPTIAKTFITLKPASKSANLFTPRMLIATIRTRNIVTQEA